MAQAGVRTEEVRLLLNDSLESLRLIGRQSLMSEKARKCLLRFLDVFDSMSKCAHGAIYPASTASQQSFRLIHKFC